MQPLAGSAHPGLRVTATASVRRMEPKKRHDGYRSFSYMVEGED
jgi:hypothetical protein